MKLLIFGGTSDARALLDALSERYSVTYCVVSDYARNLLPEANDRLEILVGPKTKDQIMELQSHYPVVIDATHPYAPSIHETLVETVPPEKLLRLSRSLPEVSGFSDYASMVQYLENKPGNILLTTGVRSATDFSPLANRSWLRLLPDPKNLQLAIDEGFLPSHLIAMHGPFTHELNAALMKALGIQFLVTKASGVAGGFSEKMSAANELGVEVLILTPPKERGLSLTELLQELEAR